MSDVWSSVLASPCHGSTASKPAHARTHTYTGSVPQAPPFRQLPPRVASCVSTSSAVPAPTRGTSRPATGMQAADGARMWCLVAAACVVVVVVVVCVCVCVCVVVDGGALGVDCVYAAGDLSTEAGVLECLEAAGPIDVLVNNAGVQFVAPVEQMPLDQWNKILAVNLTAPFLLISKCIPRMYALLGSGNVFWVGDAS